MRRRRLSVFRGFQLLCVLAGTVLPTSAFEPFVREFLERHMTGGDAESIEVMASREGSPLQVSLGALTVATQIAWSS